MEIDLEITWLNGQEPSWGAFFEKFLRWTWQKLQIEKVELGVVFYDEENMARTNRLFRGLNEPTDVLSFVSEERPSPRQLCGDLIICPPYVAQNAFNFFVAFEQELCRVGLHGELHLLGWDHSTNEANEPMLLLQEELLKDYFNG